LKKGTKKLLTLGRGGGPGAVPKLENFFASFFQKRSAL
jgi:hypothetical protein